MTVQAGLRRTWLEPQIVGFLMQWLISEDIFIVDVHFQKGKHFLSVVCYEDWSKSSVTTLITMLLSLKYILNIRQ